MKIVDIANEIFLENASPSDTSIPAIAFWLRSNVGKLNTLLYEDFYIDSTTLEIYKCPEWRIGMMGAAVLKLMFKVYRIDLDIRNMLFAATSDSILKAADQEFIIEKVNKSELLKTLTAFKKETLKELQELTDRYRTYCGTTSQVAGDDTISGHYVGITNQYTRNMVGGGSNSSNFGDKYEAG